MYTLTAAYAHTHTYTHVNQPLDGIDKQTQLTAVTFARALRVTTTMGVYFEGPLWFQSHDVHDLTTKKKKMYQYFRQRESPSFFVQNQLAKNWHKESWHTQCN